MPTHATVLPDPTCLHLLNLTADSTSIKATVVTTAPAACCPLCGRPSTHIHSRYTRRLADVPWHGITMHLVLHVRTFFCDHASCARRVFTERLPGVVAPYARRTLRLDHWFTVVGFAAGGAAGARLLREFGLVATPAMVVARLRAYGFAQCLRPRVLGVDDFAFRRHRQYGTNTAPFWWTWNGTVRWVCCPTAVPRLWPDGSRRIRVSRSSAATGAGIMRSEHARGHPTPSRLPTGSTSSCAA